ncbi:MAG: glutamate--cysteine ligase [Bdellovibrionota bacterium]
MVQDEIHKLIVKNLSGVEGWFKEVRKSIDVPFYSSYDIRDFGHKVTAVDANIYPAGFNNICPTDREHCDELVKEYILRHYGDQTKRVLLLTEEHTSNPFYWDNVAVLKQLITGAGFDIRIAFPRMRTGETMMMQSASYGEVEAHAAVISSGKITVAGFEPDVVISNNDFSEAYEEWGELSVALNPPRELGWYRRKKSTYFKHYNELATEFAKVIGIDPWLLTVETELFSDFDMGNEESKQRLATRVDAMIARLKVEYDKRGIKEEPFVFVKNNAGTYGLAVMRIQSGADILSLNNKTRKKMKAAKGGRDVEEVIIQEGVPSIVKTDDVTAEPAIYLLGCQLAGGFLRTHAEKGPTESLNSPGAVYKRLCVTDLKVSVEGHPMENVYGWVAKIGLLAIGRESAEMNVEYSGYRRWPMC